MGRPRKPSQCGVYSITCGGVAYVGASTNTRRRWLNHLSNLRLETHPCERLQQKFDAGYSPLFKMLELCDSQEFHEREKYWATELASANYPIKGTQPGASLTPEHRSKISKGMVAHYKGEY